MEHEYRHEAPYRPVRRRLARLRRFRRLLTLALVVAVLVGVVMVADLFLQSAGLTWDDVRREMARAAGQIIAGLEHHRSPPEGTWDLP